MIGYLDTFVMKSNTVLHEREYAHGSLKKDNAADIADVNKVHGTIIDIYIYLIYLILK